MNENDYENPVADSGATDSGGGVEYEADGVPVLPPSGGRETDGETEDSADNLQVDLASPGDASTETGLASGDAAVVEEPVEDLPPVSDASSVPGQESSSAPGEASSAPEGDEDGKDTTSEEEGSSGPSGGSSEGTEGTSSDGPGESSAVGLDGLPLDSLPETGESSVVEEPYNVLDTPLESFSVTEALLLGIFLVLLFMGVFKLINRK